MTVPCKGCEDRREACHAECEMYKAWKAYHDAQQEAIRKAKREDEEYCNSILRDLKRGQM